MRLISEDGKIVYCPECRRPNPHKNPVKLGLFGMCHVCRTRYQIKKIHGQIKPFPIESIYQSTKGGGKDGKKRVRGQRGDH